MRGRNIAILIIAIVLLASCGYQPGTGPGYRESLFEGLTPGSYYAEHGYGAAREKAVLTVLDDHWEPTAGSPITLELYAKDPITEEWDTEPYATYKGTYTHCRMIRYDDRLSDWTDSVHKDEFSFTESEGTGSYTLEDLSGTAVIRMDRSTAVNNSEYDFSDWYFPIRGTRIRLQDHSEYSWEEDTILSDFGIWVRL